jgi:hypothetical protein
LDNKQTKQLNAPASAPNTSIPTTKHFSFFRKGATNSWTVLKKEKSVSYLDWTLPKAEDIIIE